MAASSQPAGSNGTERIWPYLGAGLLLASFLLITTPAPSMGTAFSSAGALVGARTLLFCVLAAASLALALFHRRAEKALRSRRMLLAVFAAQLLFGLGYPLYAHGLIPEDVLFADFAFQGCALPFLGLAWTDAYRRLEARRAVRLALAALGIAVGTLAMTCVLPGILASLVAYALSFSTPLLVATLRPGTAAPGATAGEKTGTGEKARGVRETSSGRIPIPMSAAGARPAPLAYLLAGAACALAASNILAGSAELGGFLSWPTMVAGYAIGFATVAAGATVKTRTRLGYAHLTIAAAGILAVCYATSGLVMGGVETIGSVAKAVQHLVVVSMELAVCAFTWLALVDATRDTGDATGVAAGGLAAVNVGKAAGTLAGLYSPLDPAALSIIALIAFVPAVFLLAAAVFRGDARAGAPDGMALVDTPPDAWLANLDAACAAYGLSPREREVLVLWAGGHRLDYVAEKLCVSKNTAKTHVTHIYKKTGTANREELLQLIKGER